MRIMRKYAIGFIVGAILVSATQVYGGAVTLIGKKIQHEVEVSLFGQTLKNKAPLIDGTTYVPLREITEKLGYKAAFKDGKVEITFMSVLESEIADKKRILAAKKEGLIEQQAFVDDLKVQYAAETDTAKKKDILSSIEFQQKGLDNLIEQIPIIEQQLAELEAQKAALEAQTAS